MKATCPREEDGDEVVSIMAAPKGTVPGTSSDSLSSRGYRIDLAEGLNRDRWSSDERDELRDVGQTQLQTPLTL